VEAVERAAGKEQMKISSQSQARELI